MIPIAFMFIECKQSSEDSILEKIRTIPEISYAYRLDKSYDIVVKIESESVEKFTSAIAAIRKVADILNTDTMIGFKSP
jgi:DNA-binding Lrp family transcriptional regulator